MIAPNSLKDGNVVNFSVLQNTATYQVKLAHCSKGLWMCIEESVSQWKLTINQEIISQTISKASAGKSNMIYKDFAIALLAALGHNSQKWSVGIMTPIELQLLRGGKPAKQAKNNKLYLILSDKQNKFHYPFTFILNDMCQKQKLMQAIKTMKKQLVELKVQKTDKSQSSFSILSENGIMGEQIKLQNEELKQKIKIYEESLTQKRGAVQIDMILKDKNNLQIKAETKKREQQKQLTKMKNNYQLMERQITQIRNQVDHISRQLMILQDNMSNPAKLRSHAMRVLKSYDTQLRTSKKIVQRQIKQLETLKRNINNTKNNQRKNLARIKQIQTQIEQAKKRANIQEISNRLHSSGGSKAGGSSIGSSSKAVSLTSSQEKSHSIASSKSNKSNNNLVRQNLLKKTSDISNNRLKKTETTTNNLLRTQQHINPQIFKKNNQYKPPQRPVGSSHIPSNKPTNYQQRHSGGFKNTNSPAKSSSLEKKKEMSPAEKQRQQKSIERLMGKKNYKQSANKIIANSNINRSREIGNLTREKSLQNKPVYGVKKNNDKTQDILKRMKEVKAHYTNKAQNIASNNKTIAAKVAQLIQPNLI